MTKTIVFYSLFDAQLAGVEGHAESEMAKLADAHHFRIVDALPCSVAEGWQFLIESDAMIPWPSYIRVIESTEAGGRAGLMDLSRL